MNVLKLCYKCLNRLKNVCGNKLECLKEIKHSGVVRFFDCVPGVFAEGFSAAFLEASGVLLQNIPEKKAPAL